MKKWITLAASAPALFVAAAVFAQGADVGGEYLDDRIDVIQEDFDALPNAEVKHRPSNQYAQGPANNSLGLFLIHGF